MLKNCRGQSEIIYMILTIAIAIIVAAGVFLFGRTFAGSLGEDLSNSGLEFVAQELEANIVKLKQTIDTTDPKPQTVSVRVELPERIADRRYAITGTNDNGIELRAQGDPSVIKEMELKFWPDIKVVGLVDSTQGFVRLNFTAADNTLILE